MRSNFNVSDNLPALTRLATCIRMLSAQGVEQANSGHPGMPMGAADYAAVLWGGYLRFDPTATDWINRDRFVLSAGHGSMLLYSLLHMFGYDLPMEELEQFRQWGSKTPGHPEYGVTAGVETTTGPLGQGFANGVGMALSQRMMAARYDESLFDGRVYGIVSDGDLMEGVAAEAASLAGHLKLGNLIYLYDDNQISIGGSTDVCFTESVPARFKAYGWQVQEVDGHNMEQIAAALDEAIACTDAPSLICCKTTIGKGSPAKAGSCGVHGAPLGAEELSNTGQALQWDEAPFTVPDDVRSFCESCVTDNKAVHSAWQESFAHWQKENAGLATTLKQQCERTIPESLHAALLAEFSEGVTEASRVMSGKAIQVLAKHLPGFIGGSADLEPSTKTLINDADDVQAGAYHGRNLRFGVREHAMGAMVNGFAYSRHWIPFASTFLVFADYMRPTLRLAALSHLQSLFVFTHDSFWVGEDGPTHQPIETLQSLRLIPNLYVFRPADGMETAMCYLKAVELTSSPSALVFTRQGLPPLERTAGAGPEAVSRGAYVVSEHGMSAGEEPELVVIATGSEVHLAQQAVAKVARKVRVVSMPCRELFLEQPDSYRDEVVPPTARVVVVEAGSTSGWEYFTGREGLCIGKDSFGASAPGKVLAEQFGFTVDAVAERIKSL